MGLVLRSGGSDTVLAEPLPWPSPVASSVSISGVTHPYDHMWRTQPALRTVVDFRARNVAHVGLHVYRREADDGRTRLREGALAATIGTPAPGSATARPMTQYEWLNALVHDLDIWDETFWLKIRGEGGRIDLRRLDPRRTYATATEIVHVGARSERRFPIDSVFWVSGYQPHGELVSGCSPIEALTDMLVEEFEAANYRQQMWRSGARMTGWISRPVGTPWSEEAKSRFTTAWQARWAGSGGTGAGGTPVLEDGMEFHPEAFSAEQAQYIEARKLTRVEVAAAYHVSPVMVGVLDNANYSNVREFHKILYVDTLGPIFAQLEQAIGAQLLPEFGESDVYVEFNLREKLEGDFIEQARALQTMVGRPVMSANEGRAKINLPAVDGGDELVVPLNVLVGGQASPTDSAPIDNQPKARRGAKAWDAQHEAAYEALLVGFFERQRSSVLASLGAAKARTKAVLDDVWDADRWDAELAADLFGVDLATATAAAREIAESADHGVMTAWLAEHSAGVAHGINAATAEAVADALMDDEPLAAVDHVFDVATSSRAGATATTLVTEVRGFAMTDTARRTGRTKKTWRTTSGNPRSTHAALNGQSVGVDDTFSNGARWPGDRSLPSGERAGCRCTLEFGGSE